MCVPHAQPHGTSRHDSDPLSFPPHDPYEHQQQQQQANKRARMDYGGVAASGGLRVSGSMGPAAGVPYDDYGGIALDGGGGGGVLGYQVPLETYGEGSRGVSGRGRGGGGGAAAASTAAGGGVLGGTSYYGGAGDGLEEVRGGIVGGAAAFHGASGAGTAAALYGNTGNTGGGGAGRYAGYPETSGGASFGSGVPETAAAAGGGGVAATRGYGTSGGIGDRYGGGGGMREVVPADGYEDVRSGMVGGGYRTTNYSSGTGGGFAMAGSDGAGYGGGRRGGGSALPYDEYRSEFYPSGGLGTGGGSGGGGRVWPGSSAAGRGGRGGYGVSMGATAGVGGAGARGRGRDPGRIRGDDAADIHATGDIASTIGSVASMLADGGRGGGAVDDDGGGRKAKPGVVDKHAVEEDDGIEDEGPLGGWTEVESWEFARLPLEGKTRRPCPREVSGPIHVFDGKRKPGATGWPPGITWMVSETYKGTLEGINWPSSLVGVVLT
ncbi:unnamed protein product, partial [Ectocarpus sp. 8 AP-2014]